MRRRHALDREAEFAVLFHEHDLHLPSRTIYMGSAVHEDGIEGGVDAVMADSVVKNLHILSRLDRKPLTIFMNNIGGDEYHGAAIYDAMLKSRCFITVVVRGNACSMGSVILQAADERIMGPSSMQMIHYGTWGAMGEMDAKSHERYAREGARWNTWMEDVYLAVIHRRHPKFTRAMLEKKLRADTYLTAEESIELGLADAIG